MIVVEKMTAETVASVAALEKCCFSTPWSEKQIAEELENEWALWVVARCDDAFAGYLGIQYGPDGADIMNIATVPKLRNRGVASALLADMFVRLDALGLAWLTLEVRASNEAAIRLYEQHGFARVGLRKNYYTRPREDAILMTAYRKANTIAETEKKTNADPWN